MMITPTPRAMSPQDIVRIYVPPAPPEERKPVATNPSPTKNAMKKSISGSRTSLASLDKTNGTTDGYASNRNSIISGDATPIRRRSLYRSEEELVNHFGGTKSTSSSRRGSLGRKSPSLALESNLMGCSHMARRRSSDRSNKIHMSLENISTSNTTTTEYETLPKRMTSFEELARQDKMCSSMRITKSDVEQRFTPDDDDNFSFAQFNKVSSPTAASSKYVSESNIQYRAFSSPIEYKPLKHRPASSVEASSPDDVGKLKYSRFFSSVDDEDDYTADEKKSSDESSTSPNAKSILSTPVNEQIPLIMHKSLTDDGNKSPVTLSSSLSNRNIHTSSTTIVSSSTVQHHHHRPLYHSPQSQIDDLNSILAPIEITQRQQKSSSQSDTIHSSEFDERSYEFNINHNPKSQTKNSNADMNKIRIKINQNQRN